MQPTPDTNAPASVQPAKGMAITSLVLSLVGLCLFPLALVGLILGIVAFFRADRSPEKFGGKSMAIGGMVAGAMGLVVCPFMGAGLLLPALGRARENAQYIKSSVQLRSIGTALNMYAQQHGGYPEAGADIMARLTSRGLVSEALFESPFYDAAAGDPSYMYHPAGATQVGSPQATVLMFETPRDGAKRANVLYLDGSVRLLEADEFEALLATLKEVYWPDGELVEWGP